MNIQIINKQSELFTKIDLNTIKSFSGSFNPNTFAAEVSDLFYEKVFIDITSIENFYDINQVINFLRYLDDKEIYILLDNSQIVGSDDYIKALVNAGYYNITKNHLSLQYMSDKENTKSDALKLLSEKKDKQHVKTNDPVQSGYYNKNKKETVKTKRQQIELEDEPTKKEKKSFFSRRKAPVKIIGVQNLTKHAGSTTLTYLFYNHLKKRYKVKLVEMFKTDLRVFHDENFYSFTDKDRLDEFIEKNDDVDIILIDLNEYNDFKILDELIYLLEPTKLKINQLMKKDKYYLTKIKEKKVVVNKSMISMTDLKSLEYEMKLKSYYMLPNIKETDLNNKEVIDLLYRLGISKQKAKRWFF